MRGYLGLGSNVGDRLANLRAARAALVDRGVVVVESSSVYETEPQGELPDQPDFLNACLAVEMELPATELHELCKEIERSLGRGAGPRHGPRTIDIDVLLLDGREHRSSELEVPHPEIRGRRFVLVPLLELDAELTLPDGTPLADLLARLEGQRVDRVGPL